MYSLEQIGFVAFLGILGIELSFFLGFAIAQRTSHERFMKLLRSDLA